MFAVFRIVTVLPAPLLAESCEVPLRKTKHRASFSKEERGNQHVTLAPLALVISFLLGLLLGHLEHPTRDITRTEMQHRQTVVGISSSSLAAAALMLWLLLPARTQWWSHVVLCCDCPAPPSTRVAAS